VNRDGGLLQKADEAQIGRSVVDGVPPEHDERLDGPVIETTGQGADRFGVPGLIRLARIGDGAPDVAQRLVHQMHQVMHLSRLARAGDEDA
jgi:hypothetical protein